MRVITIPDQRMLLFSFQQPPEVAFKLVVGGPIIGERDVPQFKFIKDAFVASLEECLIGTRRSAVSLDVEWTVQEVGGYVTCCVTERSTTRHHTPRSGQQS